jgi:hypothetical protein
MRLLVDKYETFPGVGPEMALIGMKDESLMVSTERFTIPPAQAPKNKGAHGDDNRVDDGFSCCSLTKHAKKQ